MNADSQLSGTSSRWNISLGRYNLILISQLLLFGFLYFGAGQSLWASSFETMQEVGLISEAKVESYDNGNFTNPALIHMSFVFAFMLTFHLIFVLFSLLVSLVVSIMGYPTFSTPVKPGWFFLLFPSLVILLPPVAVLVAIWGGMVSVPVYICFMFVSFIRALSSLFFR